jgi:hypothetical protein
MQTGWICTATFGGIDGKQACDNACPWYVETGCACGKGSVAWNYKER